MTTSGGQTKLGTAEVTPLELTQAYSVFANQGRRIEARFITKITDAHGTVLEERLCAHDPTRSGLADGEVGSLEVAAVPVGSEIRHDAQLTEP